jgi:hypothetical protein
VRNTIRARSSALCLIERGELSHVGIHAAHREHRRVRAAIRCADLHDAADPATVAGERCARDQPAHAVPDQHHVAPTVGGDPRVQLRGERLDAERQS